MHGIELNIEHSAEQSTDPRTAFANVANNELFYNILDPGTISPATTIIPEPTVEERLLYGYTQLSTPFSITNNIQSAYFESPESFQSETDHRISQPLSNFVKGVSAKEGRCVLFVTSNTYDASKLLGKGRDWVNELKAEESELLFDKFSLQNVQEPSDERYQITETFDANILYLFDERPRIYSFGGRVINGKIANVEDQATKVRLSHDWKNELQRKYNRHYRGTRAASGGKVVYISYEDTLIRCVLLQLGISFNSMNPSTANVSFNAFVLDHKRLMTANDDVQDAFVPPKNEQIKQEPVSTPPKTKEEVVQKAAESEAKAATLEEQLDQKKKELDDLEDDREAADLAQQNLAFEYEQLETSILYNTDGMTPAEIQQLEDAAAKKRDEWSAAHSKLDEVITQYSNTNDEIEALELEQRVVKATSEANQVEKNHVTADSGNEVGHIEKIKTANTYKPETALPGRQASSDGTTLPPEKNRPISGQM